MVREHPDPYLVLGVSPTATQAEITHAYRTRLRAHHPDTRHHRRRKPPTNTSGNCWPPTPCCATPPAAPTTTAPPPTPPHHHPTAHTGPTPADRPPIRRVQIPITYRNHQHRCSRRRSATIAGRPGAPAPIAAPRRRRSPHCA